MSKILKHDRRTKEIVGTDPDKFIHYDPAAGTGKVELEGHFTARELYEIAGQVRHAEEARRLQSAGRLFAISNRIAKVGA